jgi:hypothetical protein
MRRAKLRRKKRGGHSKPERARRTKFHVLVTGGSSDEVQTVMAAIKEALPNGIFDWGPATDPSARPAFVISAGRQNKRLLWEFRGRRETRPVLEKAVATARDKIPGDCP